MTLTFHLASKFGDLIAHQRRTRAFRILTICILSTVVSLNFLPDDTVIGIHIDIINKWALVFIIIQMYIVEIVGAFFDQRQKLEIIRTTEMLEDIMKLRSEYIKINEELKYDLRENKNTIQILQNLNNKIRNIEIDGGTY